MKIFENLKDYIWNILYKDNYNTDLNFYENIYKDKPTINNFEQIDFVNTKTSDIVISLNNLKYFYNFDISYYENIYNMNPMNKLIKLKYKLILCLISNKDTTDIIIKHIMKYKGETCVQNLHKNNEEYDKLEKRYIELIKEDDINEDDNQDDDDDNNCKVLANKKICLTL